MTWHIRDALPQHLTTMFQISVAAHQNGYDTLIPFSCMERFSDRYTLSSSNKNAFVRTYGKRLDDPSWTVWVAQSDDKVIGYTLLQYVDDAVALKGLFVHPDWQGQGIGRALFEKSLYGHDDQLIQLVVIEKNLKAINLYASYGFKFSKNACLFFGAPQIVMTRQPISH